MIDQVITEMLSVVNEMQTTIQEDIKDIKIANHEKLLDRNDRKQELMENIVSLKQQLNNELVTAMQSGVDVNIYRTKVDTLENELKNLYELNGKLASIVLPVRQMYKEMVDELTASSGGNLIDVKA